MALITRDSIRQALRGGITAAQIARFLKMHAHPQQQQKAAKKTAALAATRNSHSSAAAPVREEHVVPPTVIDQIYLWENERNRFTFSDGVLYNQFLSQNDFERVRHFAEGENVCIWSNSANRTIVVSRRGHDEVKRFWRQQR